MNESLPSVHAEFAKRTCQQAPDALEVLDALLDHTGFGSTLMSASTLLAIAAIPTGWYLQYRAWLPASLQAFLARLLLRLLYPCLILGVIPERVSLDEVLSLWPLPVLLAGLLLLGRTVGYRLLPRSGLSDSGSRRSFVFIATLPNYSYLPLMLAQAAWGQRGVALVALAGIGADLVLWTVGLRALQQETPKIPWRRLLNPPLLSLLLALCLLLPTAAVFAPYYAYVQPWLLLCGSWTIPVSMFLLGVHLAQALRLDAAYRRAHTLLLAWRLGVAPGLVLLCVLPLSSFLPHPAALVLLMIGSMPGAIMSVPLSAVYNADPEFAAQHVLRGHIAWILSGSIWIGLGHWLWAAP